MMKKICIKNLPEACELLYAELQNGFFIEAAAGTSIRSFLTGDCGITESYIKDKIKTVFHNGNPVDNMDSVKISNGSVCAVSGAMPGLVGAMMRMGSPYASMRESITEKGEDISATGKKVFVKLKLFNVILSDLGQLFISGGVILERDDVVRIINKTAVKHGSSFSFTVDDLSFNSSKSGKLSDEKYIIKLI